MEGDKKRVKEQDRITEEKTSPTRVLEYEFFIHEGEEETDRAVPEDRKAKAVKKRQGYRNKSSIFFLD
jgi:hypothetical protein